MTAPDLTIYQADREAHLAELSAHRHGTYTVEWHATGDYDAGSVEDHQPAGLDTAEVIGSRIGPNRHTVMLDLDVPAKLVPSSTPGHSHLYIDVPMEWGQYKRLLALLAELGIVEPGYADASYNRGQSFVRLPWIRKPIEPF